MQFKLSSFAALLAASSSAIAAPINPVDGQKAVVAMKSLTTASGEIIDALQPNQDATSTGQVILSGMKDLITEKTKDIATFGIAGDAQEATGYSAASKEQQNDICQAIATFVDAESELLNKIIGEKDNLSSTSLVAPIAAVLRTNKEDDDVLFPGLLGYAPTCAEKVKPELKDLHDLNEQAVEEYTSTD